jgi:hypothetical protein
MNVRTCPVGNQGGGITMLETPIIAALGLLVLVGIVWWLYQSG